MNAKYIVSSFVAVLLTFQLHAQNIQTTAIEWNINSTFDVEQGAITDETTRVVSSSTQITWYAPDNNIRKTMSITGATGTWTNVSSNGSIIFNVTCEESSGIVQFWKADGQTRIRIHLVNESGGVLHELNVSSLNIE
jgi:hypothetical protein